MVSGWFRRSFYFLTIICWKLAKSSRAAIAFPHHVSDYTRALMRAGGSQIKKGHCASQQYVAAASS
jgi:hypothetical protein